MLSRAWTYIANIDMGMHTSYRNEQTNYDLHTWANDNSRRLMETILHHPRASKRTCTYHIPTVPLHHPSLVLPLSNVVWKQRGAELFPFDTHHANTPRANITMKVREETCTRITKKSVCVEKKSGAELFPSTVLYDAH